MTVVQKTVLIVDDSALVRTYYRSILEATGFRVLEALNGLEALETLLTTTADLVVVDVNMPQMDGISFLRALRQKERPLSATPALVTSTQSQQIDFEAARTAGANYYLVKPIDRDRFAEIAQMFCGMAQ